MPDFTIKGNPGAIRSKAHTMASKADLFTHTGDGLAKVTTDGWISRSADRFRDKFDTEPGRWRDAGSNWKTAATALDAYADALQEAQRLAAAAEKEYHRGEQVTKDAKAAYDADVSRAESEAATDRAAGMTVDLTILPFHDPGEAVRQGALSDLSGAKSDLDAAAHTAAAGVKAGCSHAPHKRNWLEKAGGAIGGFFAGAGEALMDLGKLAAFLTMPEVVIPMMLMNDMGKGLTAEEIAAKYKLKLEDAGNMVKFAAENPAEFGKTLGKAVLDWDTWKDDPARALGHLLPDAVVAVFTAGSGTLATRGAKGAADGMKGLEALSKMDDLSKLRHLDDLPAGASSLDDFAGPLDGLGTVRGVHSGSASPEVLDQLVHSRYREILGPNAARFENGVPASGLPPEAFRMNCTRCVVATDSSLAGAPASALPLPVGQQGSSIADVAQATGRTWEHAGSYADVANRVLADGHGARGIVFQARPDVGHVFNVVNDNGVAVFLDGQTGKIATLGDASALGYLPTHP